MTKTVAANTKTLATVAKDIAKLQTAEMGADIGVRSIPELRNFTRKSGLTVPTH